MPGLAAPSTVSLLTACGSPAAFDMHPKKVTVLKVTGVDLVTLFYFLVSCNTAYLFYCSRLSDKSVSSVSKQLQVFIIANTLISVNLL